MVVVSDYDAAGFFFFWLVGGVVVVVVVGCVSHHKVQWG
jgi:hypothetical protein